MKKQEKLRGRVFGLKCTGSLGRYDPDSHSLRMSQCSLFGEEQESLQTLPRSAMVQNGKLYQQGAIKIPRSERGTTERGSGLWHTPTTMASPSYEKRYPGGKERKHPIPNLPAEVQEGVPYSVSIKLREEKIRFPTASKGMWKQDVNDSGEYAERVKKAGHQVMLPAAVKLLPTRSGQLHSKWVCWLMGYPLDWLDSEDKGSRTPESWDQEPEGLPRVIKGEKQRISKLKGLGNAIVPQCSMFIMKKIKRTMEKEEGAGA